MFDSKNHSRDLPKDDDDLNITAMIDVVLLLLIFFMITSNMQKDTGLTPPTSRHGIGVSVDQSIILSIFKSEGEPEIYLGDGREGSPVDMEAVKSYVQEGVAARKQNLIIKADRELPSMFVEDVAKTAAEVDPHLKHFVGVVDRKN